MKTFSGKILSSIKTSITINYFPSFHHKAFANWKYLFSALPIVISCFCGILGIKIRHNNSSATADGLFDCLIILWGWRLKG